MKIEMSINDKKFKFKAGKECTFEEIAKLDGGSKKQFSVYHRGKWVGRLVEGDVITPSPNFVLRTEALEAEGNWKGGAN
jgi:hypothetical protein